MKNDQNNEYEHAIVGAVYQHVDGGIYEVVNIAISSGDSTPSVVYVHRWPFEYATYVRPLAEWTPDRFTKITHQRAREIQHMTSRAVAQRLVTIDKQIRKGKAMPANANQSTPSERAAIIERAKGLLRGASNCGMSGHVVIAHPDGSTDMISSFNAQVAVHAHVPAPRFAPQHQVTMHSEHLGYIVQPGDTLSEIVEHYYKDWPAGNQDALHMLVALNKAKYPLITTAYIQVGWTLHLYGVKA